MSHCRRPRGAAAALVSIVLVATLATPLAAAADPGYPTWDDVQRALQSESATRTEIARIEAILASLERGSVDAGTVALQRGEELAIAQDALDVASSASDRATSRADRAQDAAAASEKRAGQVIAALARQGGVDPALALFATPSDEVDDALYRLGAMDRLGEASLRILDTAEFDRGLAESTRAEADAAESSLADRTASAQSALDSAEAAASDAEAVVAAQKAAAATLYAQLAALKGTTAEVEQQYQQGLAWEAAQNAVTTPPVPPATTGPPLSVTPPVVIPPPTPEVPKPAPVVPDPPVPVASTVETAIAFATAQLGDAYLLNGEGPDAWDCSGLTKSSYAAAGVFIGTHSATNQYARMASLGRLVTIAQLERGDLLFYSTGGSTTATKYHVALFLGGGKMIEAPYPGQKVRTTPIRYGDLVPYAGRPAA